MSKKQEFFDVRDRRDISSCRCRGRWFLTPAQHENIHTPTHTQAHTLQLQIHTYEWTTGSSVFDFSTFSIFVFRFSFFFVFIFFCVVFALFLAASSTR